MAGPNPYATPAAKVADRSDEDLEALRNVASGQELIIYSILISLGIRATSALREAGYDVGLLGPRNMD